MTVGIGAGSGMAIGIGSGTAVGAGGGMAVGAGGRWHWKWHRANPEQAS